MEERDLQQQLEQYAVDFHSANAAAAGGGHPGHLHAALAMALGGGQQPNPHGAVAGGTASPPMKRYRPKPEHGHRPSSSVDEQYGGEPGDDDTDHVNPHIQLHELMTSDHHQKYLEAAASAVDHHVMMLQQHHHHQQTGHGPLIPTALPLLQQQPQNQPTELGWGRMSIDESLQNRASASLISLLSGGMGGAGGGGGAEMGTEQRELLQSHIVSHPLFQQLLDAHVACLKMGTPSEKWPDPAAVEAQLAAKQQELQNRLLMLARNAPPPRDKDHLDSFMLSFTLLLQTFRDQLREHIHVHTAEAMAACSEIKEAFLRLTGKEKLDENNTNANSDDDDEAMDDEDYFDLVLSSEQQQELQSSAGHSAGFNPGSSNANNDLMMGGAISDVDRTLMENVRKELKLELKQSYRSKLADVREEIMRKRRAGKLPGITTSVLKEWWDAHSKWPYPTEEEKVRLAQETGLDLKQINNWFINQRKRNWNTNRPLEWPHVDLGATFSLGPSTS